MNIVKSLHASLLHSTHTYMGRHYFTVSVLWGFRLDSGEPVLEQDLWTAIGNMIGRNELFDAGRPKLNAEFLVHGSFFSPNGEPVKGGRVAVSLGDIHKELAVFGDRQWVKGLGATITIKGPVPMTTMPVSFANAFGGPEDKRNPAGKGMTPVKTEDGTIHPLPNIEYPDKLIGSPGDRPSPAGFGRVDVMWEPRSSRSGTYDETYIQTRIPGFPDDLDFTFFNDAPRDQWQKGFYEGNEAFTIHNMHPEKPVLKGRLPSIHGRSFVYQMENDEPQFKEIATRLDTVWFFPEDKLGVLIHRGTIQVAEDDSTDIRQVLIAHENMADEQRSTNHYRTELDARLDPETGGLRMMNSTPLIPEGCVCGFQLLGKNPDGPVLEQLGSRNMEAYTAQQLEKADAQLAEQKTQVMDKMVEAGFDADPTLASLDLSRSAPTPEEQAINEMVEAALPGAISDPENIDFARMDPEKLNDIQGYIDKLSRAKQKEADQQLADEITRLKSLDTGTPEVKKAIGEIETVLANRHKPPALPRFDIDEQMVAVREHYDNVQNQMLNLHSLGIREDALAKMQIDLDDIESKVKAALADAADGYRLGAHCMPEASSPHQGREPEIAETLLHTYKQDGQTAGGDYAFVDLSGQNLAGIDLRNAFLEYADLSGADLTGANLENAICAHANLTNTNFSGANLTGANLGATIMTDTRFADADLTEAILSKAVITGAVFHQSRLLERAEMFLETEFTDVDFTGAQMGKSIFVNADLSGCCFEEADLGESHFINPVLDRTSFDGAVLKGVNFIQARGEGVSFQNAEMENARFIGGCTLPGAVFTGAHIAKANLMNCNLRDTDFSTCDLQTAFFNESDLSGATFFKARAREAQFLKADLSGASLDRIDLMNGSLMKARLVNARFLEASLHSVNFMNAVFGDTDFAGADLSKTIIKNWRP